MHLLRAFATAVFLGYKAVMCVFRFQAGMRKELQPAIGKQQHEYEKQGYQPF
ncbi:MAG: hypothetical protein IPH78_06065 [Bacteroidetes bacterium]|nr:hypothetical protein [Bacteroidota bacterium]MBK8657448.1 hypothetical protein [Bacteroidota bacterium]